MEETYAHELEGQTVIIYSKPQENERKPVGYYLQIKLPNGLHIQNVERIDFEPILACEPIYATLTLVHINGEKWNEGIEHEQVRVQAHIDIPAIVQEERHENR